MISDLYIINIILLTINVIETNGGIKHVSRYKSVGGDALVSGRIVQEPYAALGALVALQIEQW